MNLTDEQKFLVLFSIFDLGGSASKARTLDNISAKNWYQLDERDLTWKDNRNEQIWRNELAFCRKRLVEEACIDDSFHDHWQLTVIGRERLYSLSWDVVREISPKKLTRNVQLCARSLIRWRINREGSQWDSTEAFDRYSLAPEKIEMVGGKLFNSDAERLTMLGLLLENLGADAAVRLGDPAVWCAAVASLD